MAKKQQYPRSKQECKHEARAFIGTFEEKETAAVEEPVYYYDDDGAVEDMEYIIRDKTWTVEIHVVKCPHCGGIWHYDDYGGLVAIDYLPANFKRQRPDPTVSP